MIWFLRAESREEVENSAWTPTQEAILELEVIGFWRVEERKLIVEEKTR